MQSKERTGERAESEQRERSLREQRAKERESNFCLVFLVTFVTNYITCLALLDIHGMYVNPLKDVDRLAPARQKGGEGSGVNSLTQLKPFRDDLSRSPHVALTIF